MEDSQNKGLPGKHVIHIGEGPRLHQAKWNLLRSADHVRVDRAEKSRAKIVFAKARNGDFRFKQPLLLAWLPLLRGKFR